MQPLTLKTGVEIPLSDLDISIYEPLDVRYKTGIKITHAPSGYETQCHCEHSQHQNRVMAVARMRLKLELMKWTPPVVQPYDINPFPHGQL